jgi:hypothetical protein
LGTCAQVNLGQRYEIQIGGLRGPPHSPAHTYLYYLVVSASTTDFVNCVAGVTCWTAFECGAWSNTYPWLHVGEVVGTNLSAWMEWNLNTNTQACQVRTASW